MANPFFEKFTKCIKSCGLFFLDCAFQMLMGWAGVAAEHSAFKNRPIATKKNELKRDLIMPISSTHGSLQRTKFLSQLSVLSVMLGFDYKIKLFII